MKTLAGGRNRDCSTYTALPPRTEIRVSIQMFIHHSYYRLTSGCTCAVHCAIGHTVVNTGELKLALASLIDEWLVTTVVQASQGSLAAETLWVIPSEVFNGEKEDNCGLCGLCGELVKMEMSNMTDSRQMVQELKD